jgi:hypothetical protein
MKAIIVFVFSAVLLGSVGPDNSALAARGKILRFLKRGANKSLRVLKRGATKTVHFAFPVRVKGWRNLTITNDRTNRTLRQTDQGQTLKWYPPEKAGQYYLTRMPKKGRASEQMHYENDGRPDTAQQAQPLPQNNYQRRSPLGAYGEMLVESRLVRGVFWGSVIVGGTILISYITEQGILAQLRGNPYN